MGKYDLTMKRLTSEFPEDYVRFALKTEQFAMKHLEKEAEEVLEESQKLVLEEIQDREPRADAYVALRVFSGIRYCN